MVLRAQNPGTPDLTFGTNGMVLVPTISGSDFVEQAGVQTTGHVMLVTNSILVRVDSNGVVDPSFGNNGQLEVTDFYITAMLVLPDDKVLVVGDDGADAVMRRLNTDGSTDTSFGTNGTAAADFGHWELVRRLFLADNGDIIAVGKTETGGSNNDVIVMRYDGNGDVVTTFGTNGAVLVDVAGSNDEAWDVEQLSGGDLVVGAQAYDNGNKFTVVRLDPMGQLVTSFGTNGIFQEDVTNRPSSLRRLAVDGSDRIVLGGSYDNVSSYEYAAMRLLPTGVLDNSFSGDGIREETLGTERVNDMLLRDDDGVILAGWGPTPGEGDDFLLVSYLAWGAPDPGFGASGYTRTDAGTGNDDRGVVLLRTPTGKFLFCGHAQTATGWNILLARYYGFAPISTGIADADDRVLQVHPNPATDRITLSGLPSEAEQGWFIRDLLGQEVLSGTDEGDVFSIDVSTLVPGTYLLQAGGSVQRFVKR